MTLGLEDAEAAVFTWMARNVGYVPEHNGYGRLIVTLVSELGSAEVIRRLERIRDSGQVGRGDVAGHLFAVRDAFRKRVTLPEVNESRADRLIRMASDGFRAPGGGGLASLTDAQLDALEAEARRHAVR